MSVQKLVWEGPLVLEQAAKQLKAMLFGHFLTHVALEGLRAELLRAALWELSILRQPDKLIDAAVTTQQILGRARMLWEPLEGNVQPAIQYSQGTLENEEEAMQDDEDEDDGLHRELLDILAEQGDVLSLERGRWIPAPLRLVPLSRELYLLAGGIPTILLPEPIIQALRLHSSFRQIASKVIQAVPAPYQNGLWQFQTQESWLGAVPPTLSELVEQFNQQELRAVQRSNTQSLEAYVASINKPQELRWQPLERVPDGCYLLRNLLSWGLGRYSIGEVQGHDLIKQGQLPASLEIRRLLYALGTAAGAPVRAGWERESNIFVLSNELPARERKKLTTMGSLQANKGLTYYPRRWRVAPYHHQEVWNLLTGLEIRIIPLDSPRPAL